MKNSVTKTGEETIQEERYIIIQEPGSQYVDHVTPNDDSARSISCKLISRILFFYLVAYLSSYHDKAINALCKLA